MRWGGGGDGDWLSRSFLSKNRRKQIGTGSRGPGSAHRPDEDVSQSSGCEDYLGPLWVLCIMTNSDSLPPTLPFCQRGPSGSLPCSTCVFPQAYCCRRVVSKDPALSSTHQLPMLSGLRILHIPLPTQGCQSRWDFQHRLGRPYKQACYS